MTPAEIGELFSRMNQPKLAHTLRQEDDDQKNNRNCVGVGRW
jgi:hypothetical protein